MPHKREKDCEDCIVCNAIGDHRYQFGKRRWVQDREALLEQVCSTTAGDRSAAILADAAEIGMEARYRTSADLREPLDDDDRSQ